MPNSNEVVDDGTQNDAITTNSPLMDPIWIAHAYESNDFWLSPDRADNGGSNGDTPPLTTTTTTLRQYIDNNDIHPLLNPVDRPPRSTQQQLDRIQSGSGQHHGAGNNNDTATTQQPQHHQPTLRSTQVDDHDRPQSAQQGQQLCATLLSSPMDTTIQRPLDSASQTHAAVPGAVAAMAVPTIPSVPHLNYMSGIPLHSPQRSSQQQQPKSPPTTDSSHATNTIDQNQARNPPSGTSRMSANEASNNIVDTNNQRPLPLPAKPLKPYNYYYRFERKRILKYWPLNDDEPDRKLPAEYYSHYTLNVNNSEEFQQQQLQEQWSRPPNTRRQHRKSHGLISFHDLSKRISRNWHNLPRAVQDVFRAISKKDHERYTNEMNKYHNGRHHRDTGSST